MPRAIFKSFLLMCALGCFSVLASAQTLYVGDLSFDEPTPGSVNQFDITNFVGNGIAMNGGGGLVSSSPSFTISITSLTVDLSVGGPIVVPGTDFTSVDSAGDLDCVASACNLFGDDITSATLTGTFNPTTAVGGLSGLDPGYTGIDASFITTITPGCGTTYLDAGCDTALIIATETTATGTGTPTVVPEPGTWTLFGVGAIGLLVIARKRLRHATVS